MHGVASCACVASQCQLYCAESYILYPHLLYACIVLRSHYVTGYRNFAAVVSSQCYLISLKGGGLSRGALPPEDAERGQRGAIEGLMTCDNLMKLFKSMNTLTKKSLAFYCLNYLQCGTVNQLLI